MLASVVRLSTTTLDTPRNPRSSASATPTGPPPTMMTFGRFMARRLLKPPPIVGRGEIELRPHRYDAGWVHVALAAVIMPLDLLQVDGLGNARHLIKLAYVIRQIRIVGNAAPVAFEVRIIHGVETDQGGK